MDPGTSSSSRFFTWSDPPVREDCEARYYESMDVVAQVSGEVSMTLNFNVGDVVILGSEPSSNTLLKARIIQFYEEKKTGAKKFLHAWLYDRKELAELNIVKRMADWEVALSDHTDVNDVDTIAMMCTVVYFPLMLTPPELRGWKKEGWFFCRYFLHTRHPRGAAITPLSHEELINAMSHQRFPTKLRKALEKTQFWEPYLALKKPLAVKAAAASAVPSSSSSQQAMPAHEGETTASPPPLSIVSANSSSSNLLSPVIKQEPLPKEPASSPGPLILCHNAASTMSAERKSQIRPYSGSPSPASLVSTTSTTDSTTTVPQSSPTIERITSSIGAKRTAYWLDDAEELDIVEEPVPSSNPPRDSSSAVQPSPDVPLQCSILSSPHPQLLAPLASSRPPRKRVQTADVGRLEGANFALVASTSARSSGRRVLPQSGKQPSPPERVYDCAVLPPLCTSRPNISRSIIAQNCVWSPDLLLHSPIVCWDEAINSFLHQVQSVANKIGYEKLLDYYSLRTGRRSLFVDGAIITLMTDLQPLAFEFLYKSQMDVTAALRFLQRELSTRSVWCLWTLEEQRVIHTVFRKYEQDDAEGSNHNPLAMRRVLKRKLSAKSPTQLNHYIHLYLRSADDWMNEVPSLQSFLLKAGGWKEKPSEGRESDFHDQEERATENTEEDGDEVANGIDDERAVEEADGRRDGERKAAHNIGCGSTEKAIDFLLYCREQLDELSCHAVLSAFMAWNGTFITPVELAVRMLKIASTALPFSHEEDTSLARTTRLRSELLSKFRELLPPGLASAMRFPILGQSHP